MMSLIFVLMRSISSTWGHCEKTYTHVVELEDGRLVIVQVSVVVPCVDELLEQLGREQELKDLDVTGSDSPCGSSRCSSETGES